MAPYPMVAGVEERGLRAGTENVASAVEMGRRPGRRRPGPGETARLTGLRNRLAEHLRVLLPGRVHLNGHREQRLSSTLNASMDGAQALSLLTRLDTVAAGPACHAGLDRPSTVPAGDGDPDRALGALRLSLGRWTTVAEVDTAARAIAVAADLVAVRFIVS